MAAISFKSLLIKKEKNGENAWNFYFTKPEFTHRTSHNRLGIIKNSKKFTYLPGQYVKINLDIKNPDARGVSRYFTLSSSPQDTYLMVTTRILKSTFKLSLNSLAIGQEVQIRGPWGDFVLDKKETRPVVFIAGGIGITPFQSIIKSFLKEKGKIPKITLFVSYKTSQDVLFKREMDFVTGNKNIRVITVISSENKERIEIKFLQKHLVSLDKYAYYISGSEKMVSDMKRMLTNEAKISETHIKTDDFPGY
ncbi:MAG TPA: FAD-dependent oxidoreductase [Candidatus Levybacteria bacterium]|nr:FAD-dependent oxidoreductase [Candidatus Levybacteria bacterium]